MEKDRKKYDFLKERSLIIPQTVLDKITLHPLIQSLYLTDIGFFPKAKFHYRQRIGGCSQAILILCIEGEGVIEIDSKQFRLLSNQFIIIPANTTHCYFADLVNPWSIYWLHFNGHDRALFSDLYRTKDDSSITLTPVMVHSIVSQFNDLYQILIRGYSNHLMIHLSSKLRHLLTSLSLDEGQVNGKRLINYNYIDICIHEMKENIHQQLTLDHLAKKVALSKNYLVFLFHEKTGYSPVNYFIHLKIQLACHYLDTSDLSIKEISQKVGYQDAYYFSRIFKKIMQQSPKQYRELTKG